MGNMQSKKEYPFTKNGALNFTHDLRESEIANTFKVLEHKTRHGHTTRGLWFRITAPILISIGLILAIISLIVGAKGSEGYGIHSFVVNPPYNTQYHYNAYPGVNYQIWVLRAAQGADADTISLTLPDPTNMQEGSIIVVKNASVRIPTGDGDNTTPALNQPIEIYVGTSLIDTIGPISPPSPNVMPYKTYVVSKGNSSINEWYRNAIVF
jgi:hypothetical protein